MNEHLDFLLTSILYNDLLHPEHLADLRKSGLTDATIRRQKIRTVPPWMIRQLLGFTAPKVQHAYLLPFVNPHGGWMDHVRMKIFPTSEGEHTTKYLQPRQSGVRLYFPLATLDAVLRTADPLYIVEGEKKALAVAQTGLPTIGICGIEGWHTARSSALHHDFDDVGLARRTVFVIPDGDWKRNHNVHRAVQHLGAALRARGAEGRLVHVPEGFKGIDDYLVAQ